MHYKSGSLILSNILLVSFAMAQNVQLKSDSIPMFNSNNISDLANVLIAIISFLNLIIIIVFYIKDNKERKRDRLEAKHDKKLEYEMSKRERIEYELYKKKSFWFREIILKTNIEHIDNFYNLNDEIVTSYSNKINTSVVEKNNLKTTIKENYNDKKKDLLLHFIDLIKILDKTCASKLEQILLRHDDLFWNTISEINKCTSIAESNKLKIKFEKLNKDSKLAFLAIIYEFEVNNYKSQ